MKKGVHKLVPGEWFICLDGFAAEPDPFDSLGAATAAYADATGIRTRAWDELRALESRFDD